jgi:hypothetical protein
MRVSTIVTSTLLSLSAMSDYAFGLKTPRDLLQKAHREVERLTDATQRASTDDDIKELQDIAINAALTIWHVCDWIANSTDPRCKAAICRIKEERACLKQDALSILREHVLDDSNMALCDALANGAKHFAIKPRALDPSRVFTRPDDTGYSGTSTVKVRADVTAPPAVAVAIPYIGRYFAKIALDDDRSGPALEVFTAALAFWDKFFETYNL